MIQSRKTEERYVTNDPKRMLNKYLVNNVRRTWVESFVDEDTNEVVDIERSEILFHKGTLITQDVLVKIRFYMAEGAVEEVEVSNQKRECFEMKNSWMFPYMAKVQIKDKKVNVLLYALGVENAIEIIKDYVELNFEGMFNIISIKEYDSCIILIDKLKGVKYSFEQDFCKGKISAEEFLESLAMQVDEEQREEEEEKISRKWYRISAKITISKKDGEETEETHQFAVRSTSAERANMLINIYLRNEQDKQEQKAISEGKNFEKKGITAAIEESSIVTIGCFIPKEFSEVYKDI